MATDYVINPERLQTFFTDLETRKALLTTITNLHKTLTNHFTSLQHSLSQKSQTLDSQIESFNSQSKKALESLENRENAIPERESAAAARVEEQKAVAISDFENSESLGERNLSEELRMYFRRMDSGGLMKFLLAKKKESGVLRAEIAAAVEEAVDPLKLVVDVVEEFVEMKVEGKGGMADRRLAYGMFIQAVVPVAVELGGGVTRSVKEKATEVLERWKGVLGGGEGSGGVGAGEATMFLQMVVGFGLKEKFEEEFLKKLVLEFAARREMAKLAVALGFGDKMEEIIDQLVKSGKEIEAVYFASESGLIARFPPVSLLKSSLRNCRKNANTMSKNGNYSMAAVEEANNWELNATRAIIKCVEDHKLGSQFSIDILKKRVTQLEKAKADKKKSAPLTSKPSNKRAHGGRGSLSGLPSFRPPKARRISNASPAFRHGTLSRPHQASAARFSSPYTYPTLPVYEGASTASYGPGYVGTHTQSPVGLPQQYAFAPQDVGAGGSYAEQGSYGGQSYYSAYDYGGVAAAAPTYPPTYTL